ncbi:MAG TPA: hypothetical protein VGW35_10710 [Methylomirabilota bacterium]|jgi:hypothetical protein|nr:hypothetical protein [Methylomirabilota bacterium]
MRRGFVTAAAIILIAGPAVGAAQEARPGPVPMTPGGAPTGGMGGGRGGGMMGGGMMGMHSGMPGMRGRDHLEHLMVHDPKAAARIMRFRADMLRAISEVLQRHATELEKAQ